MVLRPIHREGQEVRSPEDDHSCGRRAQGKANLGKVLATSQQAGLLSTPGNPHQEQERNSRDQDDQDNHIGDAEPAVASYTLMSMYDHFY